MLPRDRSRLVPCRWPASLRFLAPVVPTKQLLSAQGVASRSTPFYRVWETRAARNSAYTILESGNGVTKGWIFRNPSRSFLSNGTRNTYPIRTIRRSMQIDGYSRRLAASSIDETRSLSNELRNDAYRRGVRFARPSSTSRKVKAGLFGSLAGGERAGTSNWSKNESTASHGASTSPRHRLDIASGRAETQLVNSVRVTQLA